MVYHVELNLQATGQWTRIMDVRAEHYMDVWYRISPNTFGPWCHQYMAGLGYMCFTDNKWCDRAQLMPIRFARQDGRYRHYFERCHSDHGFSLYQMIYTVMWERTMITGRYYYLPSTDIVTQGKYTQY